jgi:exopolysaccharide biosynthesis predicted pyruvyltransferase EpsI
VLTDRLDGCILSILIGKPSVIVDNSYGKISYYCHTWTVRNDKSVLVSDLTTLHAEAEKLEALINFK